MKRLSTAKERYIYDPICQSVKKSIEGSTSLSRSRSMSRNMSKGALKQEDHRK